MLSPRGPAVVRMLVAAWREDGVLCMSRHGIVELRLGVSRVSFKLAMSSCRQLGSRQLNER